jgi:murein DD-endopeptidase MepM/ murein hydrolase activator NlpD
MVITITQPVGGSIPNLNRSEIKSVQVLLNRHRVPTLPKISEDGIEGPETRSAIEEFQKRIVRMARPDGRVDPNGATMRALNEASSPLPTSSTPQVSGSFYFPFARLPSESWLTGARAFASNRSKGARAHAGCDLYFPQGTWIHAITSGKVVRGPYPFYCQTFAIEIDHGNFLARYGEVQSQTTVRVGDDVVPGQKIAKVGHLVGIQVPSDMLHLELYSKSASGPLSVQSASQSKKRADGVPFLRRMDLMNPTPYLNQWKNNLPS